MALASLITDLESPRFRREMERIFAVDLADNPNTATEDRGLTTGPALAGGSAATFSCPLGEITAIYVTYHNKYRDVASFLKPVVELGISSTVRLVFQPGEATTLRNGFLDIAASSLVGAAAIYGLVSAGPHIAQMKQDQLPSAGHVFAADFVNGPLSAMFSAGGGGAEAEGSSFQALRSHSAGPRGAENADGHGVVTNETAAESADTHAIGVDLMSLKLSGATSSYGRGNDGGGYASPGVGLLSPTQALGAAAPIGGGGTEGLGSDVTSNASANGLSAAPLKTALSAVPEPSTWAMMLVGAGMLGSALRRRSGRHRGRPSPPRRA